MSGRNATAADVVAPDSLSPEERALAEALGTAVAAIIRARRDRDREAA